jgi:hypothetical protein
VVAEAKRQQMIESTTMMSSQLPMPVSPRDNHLIHGQTIQELLTTIAAPVLSSPNPPPELMKATELNLNHLLEHLKVGSSMGLNKDPAFGELEKFAMGFKAQLEQVVQINTATAATTAVVQDKIRAEGLPPAPEEEAPLETAPGVPAAPIPFPSEAPALADVPA